MGAKIKALGVYLPEFVLTNIQLANDFGRWEPEKIENKLGIKERHISAENETAGDMAFYAALKVLENYDKRKIDMLILCTQSPDYFLPTTACVLQKRLELKTDLCAYDFNLGCSGFVYGLAMAKSFIKTGIASSVLLITSETYSKHIHPNDLALKTVFGDGAAATIIESSVEEHIFEFVLGTDGSGKDNLIVPNGGFRNAYDPLTPEKKTDSEDIYTDNNLFMNGPEIFNFTNIAVPRAIEQCLIKNKMTLDQVDYFIFHQANKYMIEYLRKKIGIPKEKFYVNMLLTGNTVSATIPIAYSDALDNGKIAQGNKVLLCGFGVGYSWGAVIVEV
jgi:3-oxoacyl-[acyl-carrier-protein] synthase III